MTRRACIRVVDAGDVALAGAFKFSQGATVLEYFSSLQEVKTYRPTGGKFTTEDPVARLGFCPPKGKKMALRVPELSGY